MMRIILCRRRPTRVVREAGGGGGGGRMGKYGDDKVKEMRLSESEIGCPEINAGFIIWVLLDKIFIAELRGCLKV